MKRQKHKAPVNVWHLSGGRTSALQTILGYRPGDVVIFCDTGREHEGTYEFLDDFEKYENIPVFRLQYPGGWKRMLEKNRKAIPNRFKRSCTEQLKIKTARRALRSLGYMRYTQFIGFRFDEQTRIRDYKERWQQVNTRFLLNELKITKPNVLDYFTEYSPYDLQVPEGLGNCDLCFLKGKALIMALLQREPHRGDKWIEDEEDPINNPHGFTYIPGTTYRQLRDAAALLGKQYQPAAIKPEFNCSCSSF